MTTRYAAAYLRKSKADDANPGAVSHEAQEAAILRAVQRDGWTGEVRYFEDWNRSADETKEAKRTAYLAMLAAVERGEVETVYAAALDRLYRSMRGFVRLQDIAKAHGTHVVTDRDGVLGGDGSPMATAYATITAAFTTLELDTIKARNHAAQQVRKDRGDRMGVAPYGQRVVRDADGRAVKPIRWEDDPERPLAPVLEAYRRAGTVLGACRLLDDVPTARGNGGKWHPSALTLILARAGVLPPSGKRVQVSRSALLSGLLVCHCGTILTPDHGKRGYYCRYAHWRRTDVHASGPGFVREDALLPYVKAEAARLHIPSDDDPTVAVDTVALGQQDDGARDSLAERKRRLAIGFADGLLEEPEYREQLAAIGREVEHLDASAEVVDLPPLDWSQPPETVNPILRALFFPIQLNPDMTIQPIKWRVPEWRAE